MSTVYLAPSDDISSAVNDNPAGTSFHFAPGIYRNVSVTAKDEDSFIGTGPGVVFTGSIAVSGWSYANGYWSASGFPASEYDDGVANPGRNGLAQIPEDLYVNSKPYLRVGSVSEVGPGDFYASNGSVTIADNPTGKTTTAGVQSVGIDGADTTGVTIQQITFEQYANQSNTGAIDANDSSGWDLWLVNAIDNHGAGLQGGSNMTVTGGDFSNNGQLGIFEYDESNLALNGVTANYNNYAGYSDGWGAGGAKILTTNGVTVENSVMDHNQGDGLWFDTNNQNVTVNHNDLSYNLQTGMQYEASFGATTVSGNTFDYNDRNGDTSIWSSGLIIQDSEGMTATNNTVIANPGAYGIGMMDDGRPAAAPLPQPAAIGNTVENNTIVYLGAGTSGGYSDGESSSQIFNGSNVWDNNTYVARSAQDVIFTWNNQWYEMSDGVPLIDQNGKYIYTSDPLAYIGGSKA